jgi:hypothetical protein
MRSRRPCIALSIAEAASFLADLSKVFFTERASGRFCDRFEHTHEAEARALRSCPEIHLAFPAGQMKYAGRDVLINLLSEVRFGRNRKENAPREFFSACAERMVNRPL